MDAATEIIKITQTVLEILKSSNMEETTEYMIRNAASEKLGMDLSDPIRKKFVRSVVELYLAELQAKEEAAEAAKEKKGEEAEEKLRRAGGGAAKEYDDNGDLIICRLSGKRRVKITKFIGKTMVSIREYYKKDGKEEPTAKGINLTKDQWASLKKNIPAIEDAIKKMESRLN